MGNIQLKQMLRDEAKICDDPISIWNRLVNQIDRMNIDDKHQIGMSCLGFVIHYYTIKSDYFNIIRDLNTNNLEDVWEIQVTLLNREPQQHLWKWEKNFIVQKIRNQVNPIKENISLYSLSIATAKRILKEASISENELKIFHRKNWHKILKSDAVKSSVASFIENSKYPVYWKDVTRNFETEYNKKIGAKHIHEFLKNNLNLSFKRGRSQMNNYDFVKIRLQKGIFAWRLCKMIPKIKLIINIDEASVSKNIKTHYA